MAKKDEEQAEVPVFVVEAVPPGVRIEVNVDVLSVEQAVALRGELNSALMGFVR